VASPELSDPRSSRVRRLRRLARRASRADEGRFLVEGAQSVREAVAAAAVGTAVVEELLVTDDAAARHAELIAAADVAGVAHTTVSTDVAAALSETVTPQGLVAVVESLDLPLERVVEHRPRLVAVLADVRDPGNAGSVIRAADAAGADAVVLAGDSVDPYNGKAVRASVGSIFHVPLVCGVGVTEATDALRAAGLTVVVADGSGVADLDEVVADGTLSVPTAWVFGNEAWGVRPEVRAVADHVVRIPIYGRAESLNLATAAALCLYASARGQGRGQREAHPTA
jgi:TrmH family RNA methyltransferase